MKGKKILFLFLALLLPVAIFVFLKLFGENEFHVPVLHEEDPVEAPQNCEYTYPAPYHVADTIMTLLTGNRPDSLYVLYFDPGLQAAMNRILHEFRGAPVKPVELNQSNGGSDLQKLRDCILLMKPDVSATVVDHRGRIRGYYDAADRDEVDRMIVEMKIILKQY